MRRKNLNNLRKTIVEAAFHSGEGHIPSALSILDILWVLYGGVLNVSPKSCQSISRDRFILSKGQASLGLYAILSEKKFFPKREFKKFGSYGGILGGHPDMNKIPGVEASTGSLGHGFPMAAGVSLGLKIQHINAKVYVLIGDGECNEGSVWETALIAAHHKLDNLCCIIDHNHSTDRALKVDDLEEKFRSFNWKSLSVNGHDQLEIKKALMTKHPGKPLAIVANTIKGHGIKIMENNPAWHHKAPTREELSQILQELI
ncbi:MAG: transketolase [Patescibacteria group bacterium]|nr:transketolase [Patescibacteria group bacterium]MCL5431586.1 transketolase [Patescibacteria group bacterium]